MIWGIFVAIDLFLLFSTLPFFYNDLVDEDIIPFYIAFGAVACLLGPVLLFALASIGVGYVAKRIYDKKKRA